VRDCARETESEMVRISIRWHDVRDLVVVPYNSTWKAAAMEYLLWVAKVWCCSGGLGVYDRAKTAVCTPQRKQRPRITNHALAEAEFPSHVIASTDLNRLRSSSIIQSFKITAPTSATAVNSHGRALQCGTAQKPSGIGLYPRSNRALFVQSVFKVD
jgi:hypothetical protein